MWVGEKNVENQYGRSSRGNGRGETRVRWREMARDGEDAAYWAVCKLGERGRRERIAMEARSGRKPSFTKADGPPLTVASTFAEARRAVRRRSEPPGNRAQPARNLRLPHKLPATARKITANPIRAHCGSESPKIGGYGVSQSPATLNTWGSHCAGGRESTTG